MAKKFIKEAIKHKGSLTRWAHKHGFILSDGSIDLDRSEAYLKRLYRESSNPASDRQILHRLRQVNLARNLKRISKGR